MSRPIRTKQTHPTPVGPLVYTIREAAELLRLTTWSVYKLCDDGSLEAVYQGRRRYVTADGLTAYVASLPNTPGR